MTLRDTGKVLGALNICAILTVATLHGTKSKAQSVQPQPGSNASPIYGIPIPVGYRDWRVISVSRLAGSKVKQARVQLGNDIAIEAYRAGKLPFPDGAIIAALHWNEAPSNENNEVLADGFPGAGLQSFIPTWHDKAEGRDVRSCSMVITEPDKFVAEVHDRMPVILEKPQFEQWMIGTPDEAAELMKPAGEDVLQRWTVSKRINSSRTPGDDDSLNKPIALAA
jgi:hypothetical protein